MRFTFDQTSTDRQGGFVAHGICFDYKYDAAERNLNMRHLIKYESLIDINMDRRILFRPKLYVTFLEKATQIYALIYSQNLSYNIAQTIDEEKLPAILNTIMRAAQRATELQTGNYRFFEKRMCNKFELSKFLINHYNATNGSNGFWTIHIKTKSGQAANIRSNTLHDAIGQIAQKIRHDLFSHEITNRSDKLAYALMTLSTKLMAIEKIIDPDFVPSEHVLCENKTIKTPKKVRA